MRLRDIISQNLSLGSEEVAADQELATEVQQILINHNLLEPPASGFWGPKSDAALQRFQHLTDCSELEDLGKETAKKLADTPRLHAPTLFVVAVHTTRYKMRPVDSSTLPSSERVDIYRGQTLPIVFYEMERNHVRIVVRQGNLKGSSIWYAFLPHIEIWEGDGSSMTSPGSGRRLSLKPQHQRPSSGRGAPPTEVKLPVPYHTQNNNYYNPSGACNVTSVAMVLNYLEIPRQNFRYNQYEDELYRYMLDNGLSRHSPWHLSYVMQDYGAKAIFKTNATMDEAKQWLAGGNPAIAHGYLTWFGHIIVLVGYNDRGFIVHDPYGEWFSSGYRRDLNGAFLNYSYGLIRRTCIPDGQFWCHLVTK